MNIRKGTISLALVFALMGQYSLMAQTSDAESSSTYKSFSTLPGGEKYQDPSSTYGSFSKLPHDHVTSPEYGYPYYYNDTYPYYGAPYQVAPSPAFPSSIYPNQTYYYYGYPYYYQYNRHPYYQNYPRNRTYERRPIERRQQNRPHGGGPRAGQGRPDGDHDRR
jgi:hypothetical protein